MISASLTANRTTCRRADGLVVRALAYEWRGRDVPIADSADNVLRIIEAVRGAASDDDKVTRIASMLFPDAAAVEQVCAKDAQAFGALLKDTLRDVCGIELGGDGSPRLWDAEEDAALIRVSLRAAYGVDWDAVREHIPFGEFCALVASLGTDTPLGFAMHYRNPENRPKPDKYNKDLVAEFDRLHAALALGPQGANVEGRNAAMSDMARALMERAR